MIFFFFFCSRATYILSCRIKFAIIFFIYADVVETRLFSNIFDTLFFLMRWIMIPEAGCWLSSITGSF